MCVQTIHWSVPLFYTIMCFAALLLVQEEYSDLEWDTSLPHRYRLHGAGGHRDSPTDPTLVRELWWGSGGSRPTRHAVQGQARWALLRVLFIFFIRAWGLAQEGFCPRGVMSVYRSTRTIFIHARWNVMESVKFSSKFNSHKRCPTESPWWYCSQNVGWIL